MTFKARRAQFIKRFRNLDIFGYPISLRYQNSETYKSLLGATLTVLVSIGISTYFFLLLVELVRKNSYTITTTVQRGIMNEEESTVILNANNFDIGIYVYYGGDEEILKNIDEYFQYQIQSIYMEYASNDNESQELGNNYIWDMTNLTLTLCDETRFGGEQDQAVGLGIPGRYYCPEKDFNLTMFGSYSSEKAKVIQILIHYCEQQYLDWKFPGQNRTCKTKEESDAIIGGVQIYIPILTQYFDQKEFDKDPIKNAINSDLYNTIHPNISNNKNYKITRYNLLLRDSYVSSYYGDSQRQFYDFEVVHSYMALVDAAAFNPLMTFQFLLNEKYYDIERKVQTIFDVFSLIGGIASFFIIGIKYGCQWFQQYSFYQSVIKSIFFVEQDQIGQAQKKRKQKKIKKDVKLFQKSQTQQPKSNTTTTIFPRIREEDDEDDNNNSQLSNENKTEKASEKSEASELELPSMQPTLNKEQSYYRQQSLHNYIKQLTQLNFTTWEFLQLQFKQLCYKVKKYKQIRVREKLYQQGVQRIEQRFDVINLFKQLAKIDLISSIILSRYQKHLLPYLKVNILHNEDDDNQNESQSQGGSGVNDSEINHDFNGSKSEFQEDIANDEFLQIYIKQLIMQSRNNSKVDKRILKQLLPKYIDKNNILKRNVNANSNIIVKSLLKKYSQQLPNSPGIRRGSLLPPLSSPAGFKGFSTSFSQHLKIPTPNLPSEFDEESNNKEHEEM